MTWSLRPADLPIDVGPDRAQQRSEHQRRPRDIIPIMTPTSSAPAIVPSGLPRHILELGRESLGVLLGRGGKLGSRICNSTGGTTVDGKKHFLPRAGEAVALDDDGYVIQWLRSPIPSTSLAALYGLAQDCVERRVLGPDVEIDVHAFEETNTSIRCDRLAAMIRSPAPAW